MKSASFYDADYFEFGRTTGKSNFQGSVWQPERAFADAELYLGFAGVAQSDRLLDYGCAKGFLVRAITLLGFDCEGADWSDYAIDSADASIRSRCHLVRDPADLVQKVPYDLVLANHLLEHCDESSARQLLRGLLGIGQRVLVTVPLGDGARYLSPRHEYDQSHILRESAMWWSNMLVADGARITSSAVVPNPIDGPDMGLFLVSQAGSHCRRSTGAKLGRQQHPLGSDGDWCTNALPHDLPAVGDGPAPTHDG